MTTQPTATISEVTFKAILSQAYFEASLYDSYGDGNFSDKGAHEIEVEINNKTLFICFEASASADVTISGDGYNDPYEYDYRNIKACVSNVVIWNEDDEEIQLTESQIKRLENELEKNVEVE